MPTAGSWGAAVIDALSPQDDDVHVDEYRMSGFTDTPLDSVLCNRRIETLLFAGVDADQCVPAPLVDAAGPGHDVVLVEGAGATTSPAYRLDATLCTVRQCFGSTNSRRPDRRAPGVRTTPPGRPTAPAGRTAPGAAHPQPGKRGRCPRRQTPCDGPARVVGHAPARTPVTSGRIISHGRSARSEARRRPPHPPRLPR
ncbi:isochorismatase family cysteine hydrolase [Streptomyces sp. NPDC047000]|uniref:cysteine hydrolase family protein n=1 Tax=Streptomyces sp. NPDC047000 TaxID=3155474 RepID=UPI0033FECFD8